MSAYSALRTLLFRLDPEMTHELALHALQGLGAVSRQRQRRSGARFPALAQELFGIRFPNPLGMAAGFDKDGKVVRGLAALGFGFVEVGTVTPRPQPGNPKPRLFRHPEARSLRNALGFNSDGIDALVGRLARLRPYPVPIGINLGLNKGTSPPEPDAALRSYTDSISRVAPLADYLAINLSSPNTPGLRDLQTEGFVRDLFAQARHLTSKPILVKLSPDLDPTVAGELAATAAAAGAAGIIATNTTTDYRLLPGVTERGGLSGEVLRERSFALLTAIARQLAPGFPLISVGGIASGAEAYRRILAGASLVQLYTGFVYGGPGLPQRIARELAGLLARDGLKTIGEAVGARRPR